LRFAAGDRDVDFLRLEHLDDFVGCGLQAAGIGFDTRYRRPSPMKGKLTITSEVPSALNPPEGCRFHPRCPHAMPHCGREAPMRKEVAPGHSVACHLY
jgi:oligopeptide/dipeptide ABC transporter ATP-binding protein